MFHEYGGEWSTVPLIHQFTVTCYCWHKVKLYWSVQVKPTASNQYQAEWFSRDIMRRKARHNLFTSRPSSWIIRWCWACETPIILTSESPIMTSSIRQKIFRSGMHRCTTSEPNQWASIIQLSSQLTQISLENSLGWCIEIEIDCYVAGATCVGGCAQFTWWNSFQHWNSTSVNSRECVLHSTVNLLLSLCDRLELFILSLNDDYLLQAFGMCELFMSQRANSRTNQPQREYLNQS